jgi:hypothetical protein
MQDRHQHRTIPLSAILEMVHNVCMDRRGFVREVAAVVVAFGLSTALAPPSFAQSNDVCAYLSLAWSDMSAREQALWQRLGWTGAMWDSGDENNVPDTEYQSFGELSANQQDAAIALGYTQDSWDNTDSYCSD